MTPKRHSVQTSSSSSFSLHLSERRGKRFTQVTKNTPLTLSSFSETMAGSSRTGPASLLLLFLLFGLSAAKEFVVGGKADAWTIPSSENANFLNQWAEKSRFHVGDHLVWKYESGKDSVLQVNREDYTNCNLSNPTKEYSDGNTKVRLDHPGPFYFISGAKGHCEKGQKVIVVVMAPRSSRPTGISPAPSPADILEEGPAVAPSPTSSVTCTALQGGLVMAVGVMAVGVLAMYEGLLM